jgi:hypothetical protein
MAQAPAEPIAAATATRARDTEPLPAPPEPAPAKPVLPAPIETVDASAQGVAPLETARTDRPIPQPLLKPAAGTTGIEVADGLVAIEVALTDVRDIALGSIAFSPGSAMLPPDAGPRLEQLLVETKAPDARIKIVGEAAWPALALDRARAVGLALVRSGMPADRLELTLARGASGDRARLFLAAPAP